MKIAVVPRLLKQYNMPTPTITRLDELNRLLHCEEEEVKEELDTNEMGEINVTKIIEGLWLGNEASALNRDFLQQNNIQSVIRIQSYDTSETVKDMYRELEIAYEYYEVDDIAGEDIKSELQVNELFENYFKVCEKEFKEAPKDFRAKWNY